MLNKKKISPFELNQVLGGNYVVLTLKFDDKTVVKDTVDKLRDEIIGLNLRLEGDFLVKRKKEEIQVHQLPPSSRFQSIYKMTEWASREYLPNFSKEMGTIAYNDDTVILNLNHAICDGKYIVGVAEHIGDSEKKRLETVFPVTVDEEFTEEIKERLSKPPKFFRNDVNNTIFSGFGMKKQSTEKLIDDFFDTKTFSNYDRDRKLCRNLTAAIVTGYSLSAMALQGDNELTHIGGSMACDMRNELRNKKINGIKNIIHNNNSPSGKKCQTNPITLNHTNIFTVVPITAKISPDTKINECYNRLNSCLKNHFSSNKEDLFDYRSTMGQENPQNTDNGIMICFSNLGPIRVKKPVKDLYLYNSCINTAFSFAIPLLTYAIIDDRNDRNEFHSQVRYEGNGLTEKQARKLSKSLKHYLQTCNTNSTLDDALKELKAFQKSLD